MSADYRLTAIPAKDTDVKRVPLDRIWITALSREGFEMRPADVGASVLVTVVALTEVEVARVNATARKSAEAENPSGLGGHLRANALFCCDQIDAVVRWAGKPTYFSPWFVVEGANID